ncbi:MAG: hypothetical protein AAGA83_23545 [Cyanobacteria bacterium P01_F01_bin.116]
MMGLPTGNGMLAIAMVSTLAGCNLIAAPAAEQNAPVAGDYCYQLDTDATTRVMRLTVDRDSRVIGTVYNPREPKDSTLAPQRLSGKLINNRAYVGVEYPDHNDDFVLTFASNSLSTSAQTVYQLVDCDFVD